MKMIDTEGALERFDNDKDIYLELTDTFLALPPADFKALKEALEGGRLAEVSHHIHQLKGAALTLGADPLARTASRLETLLRGGSTDEAETLLSEISDLYKETVIELRLVKDVLKKLP